MSLLLASLAVFALGGAGALLLDKCTGDPDRSSHASRLGLFSCLAGCILGTIPALSHLLCKKPEATFSWDWNLPGGSMVLGLDALSGFFLFAIFVLAAIAAIYGFTYLKAYDGKKSMGFCWLCFNLLVGGMVLAVAARQAVLFMLAWECMALSSFFLVMLEHEKQETRSAGWTYLVASHLGALFLIALFLILGSDANDFSFASFASHPLSGNLRDAAFILALIGFGAKAGFFPLHVWLPEAHPAAPSHVSAVMSGVMIKCGIYGFLRSLTFLGAPPAWWGYLLLAVGAVTALPAVLFALSQRDIKRLLAYSSIENIGIIAFGLGAGLLGLSLHGSGENQRLAAALTALGFAGALLHVLNHSLGKGLLFLGAGSVMHGTHTRDMERLGGLLKRMPATGLCFIIGSAALCGLPPLNVFVGEFLIYLGCLKGFIGLPAPIAGPLILAVAALALCGGLAAACFAKVCGTVFLGEPRSAQASQAQEAEEGMLAPMFALAGLCVAGGLLGPMMLEYFWLPVAQLGGIAGFTEIDIRLAIRDAMLPLIAVTAVAACFFLVLGLAAWWRQRHLQLMPPSQSGTWDCGYLQPSARIQYTGSSFTQPLVDLFSGLLKTVNKLKAPTGYFPASASLETETPDLARENFFAPVFRFWAKIFGKLQVIQHGEVQLYILYVMAALLALLFWKL